jgi:hypothetical protein
MYHCHVLHHEDDGMMGSFLVIDTSNIGIENLLIKANKVQVYPNPSTEIFVIKMPENNRAAHYEVISINGTVIEKQNIISTNTFTINLSNQTNGLYLLHIISADENKHFTQRINLIK